MVGQVFVHLQNVVRAFSSVARRSSDRLIVAEAMTPEEVPVSHFLARAENPQYDYGFWHHSRGLFIELAKIAGFRLERESTGSYTCNVADHPDDIEITTMVFRR